MLDFLTDTSPLVLAGWEFFLEAWHRASARLIADGVPTNLVFPCGVWEVLRIWDIHKKTIKILHTLPKWDYHSAYDSEPPTGDADQFQYEAHPTFVDEDPFGADDAMSTDGSDLFSGYIWPSDCRRFELLSIPAVSAPPQPVSEDDCNETTMIFKWRNAHSIYMGQHRVSSFRILLRN
jgi:hypothetical protein